MKLVLGMVLLINVNAYGSELAEKSRSVNDISINSLIQYACDGSEHFNPLDCMKHVAACYDKTLFPKTFSVAHKLEVFSKCVNKIITDV